MTAAEAFKFGFLLKCAQDGLSSTQIKQRIKLAFPVGVPTPAGVANTVGATIGAGKDLAGAATSTAWKSLLAAALAGTSVGAFGGYAAANAMDDNVDPRDARDAETMAEYQRAIQELTRRRQLGVA